MTKSRKQIIKEYETKVRQAKAELKEIEKEAGAPIYRLRYYNDDERSRRIRAAQQRIGDASNEMLMKHHLVWSNIYQQWLPFAGKHEWEEHLVQKADGEWIDADTGLPVKGRGLPGG